jgi:RNA polymerase sigma-70 factor (ECF subfamily)
MASAQTGDREAYRALLDDVGPELMAYLRRRLINPQDVDDVYQEVLLAIHVSRHTYEPGRPVEPWVFAIAGYVLARHLRRSRRRTTLEVLVDVLPALPIETVGPSGAEVRQAFGRLPPRQREALLLKQAGLSVDAAATRAGTTAGTFRVRVHRACKTLRVLLFA